MQWSRRKFGPSLEHQTTRRNLRPEPASRSALNLLTRKKKVKSKGDDAVLEQRGREVKGEVFKKTSNRRENQEGGLDWGQ